MDDYFGGRFWEIDFARGLAVTLMIVFHFAYDLNYFGRMDVDLPGGLWFLFPRAIAAAFILLAGVSLTISYSRARKKASGSMLFLKYLRRGAWIFSWGLLITLMTCIFIPEEYVVFGVLHFIGLSIVLAYPFIGMRETNLVFGAAAIALGFYVKNIVSGNAYLLWLGVAPAGFASVDYFPLLPWFGVVLIGIYLGNALYPNNKRRMRIMGLQGNRAVKIFCFLGRHSLLVYLMHQPVLIALLYATGMIGIKNLIF